MSDLHTRSARNAACSALAGELLLTPGLVTDILGFLIIIPQTRFISKSIALKFFKKKMSIF